MNNNGLTDNSHPFLSTRRLLAFLFTDRALIERRKTLQPAFPFMLKPTHSRLLPGKNGLEALLAIDLAALAEGWELMQLFCFLPLDTIGGGLFPGTDGVEAFVPVMIARELWNLYLGLDWWDFLVFVIDFHLRLDDVRAVSVTSRKMLLLVFTCVRLLVNLVSIRSTFVFLEWRVHEPGPSRLRDNVEASEAQGCDYEQGGESFLGRTSVDWSLGHVLEDAEDDDQL